MKPWMIIVGILVILAVIIIIRVLYELATLQITNYEIESEKIEKEKNVRLAVLSDLHNREYGNDNEKLIELIRNQSPDYILLAGDMMTASVNKDYEKVLTFIEKLREIAPVYFSLGNHEKRAFIGGDYYQEMNTKIKESFSQNDIVLLQNEHKDLDNNVSLYGLDIDYKFYKKPKAPFYGPEDLASDINIEDESRYNIMMAHSPKFFKTYALSNVDLIVSGHYHGGAVRLPGIGGVISPQFVPFPKYDKGEYVSGDTVMIVSSGCGSHKVNLRLFNKPEVMVIDIHGHSI